MMREIKGFYEEIGGFETYVGDILVVNNSLVLPIYNTQLAKHPLNNTNDNITHLDYCYFLFNGVYMSTRDVYRNVDDFFRQTNYVNTEISKKDLSVFLLELVDFNDIYQYWNWEIRADFFSLIIDDTFNLRSSPFEKQEINKNFFERNHFEHLSQFFNFEV